MSIKLKLDQNFKKIICNTNNMFNSKNLINIGFLTL